MPREFVTVVSGLPRSGTSMLMRMLEAGGMPIVTDGRRKADADNPLGYYEFEPVKDLPANSGWLKPAAGHAVKVVSALLERLPAGHQYRVVYVDRHLGEVVASQGVMLQRRGHPPERDGGKAMADLFVKHIATVLGRIRVRKDIRLLLVKHADVLATPDEVARRIDEFLDGGLDCALDCDAMAAAVDDKLWRHRASATPGGG